MRSSPTYTGLRPVAAARRNLVVVDLDGAAAAARLLAAGVDGFAERTEVIEVASDLDAALRELDDRLATATMGTRVYVAGSQGLVGRVVRLATEHGVDPRSVLTEHAGSPARRVQCVHCKVTAEDITTSLYDCPGCDLLLLVRDHYSQRLAAFQGVCVNAEDPRERPTPEALAR